MPSSPTTTRTKRPSNARTTRKTPRPSTAGRNTRKRDDSLIAQPEALATYSTGLRWLFEHVDHERLRMVRYNRQSFNLDRMRKLLNLLGKPHEQLRCVQVAGSKGKGSTCAMLASMLRNCGYGVGLYTSPHLIDLRERIAINGQMISQNDLLELFRLIASKEKSFGNQPPTFFEIMTAAAMKHFADQAVDLVVLETGLGGRLDCTTVVDPLVTGIAHISLDHTNVLGNDLPTIAREKAGIFKKDTPAISVEQKPEVAQVLRDVAEEVGAPLQFTGQDIDFSYRFEANRELGPHTRVCLTTDRTRFEHLAVPLRGEHQAHNCGLALAMLDQLAAMDFPAPEDKVIAGLEQTELPGRMEQVWSRPRVVVDGAHNGASVQALIRALGAHISYDSLVMIFATSQDKDRAGMLKQIALGADKVIFTRAKNNPRSAEPEDLMQQFGEISGKMAQSAPDLKGALKLASHAVSREDLIVITGSFYLVGEARKHFQELPQKQRRRAAAAGR